MVARFFQMCMRDGAMGGAGAWWLMTRVICTAACGV